MIESVQKQLLLNRLIVGNLLENMYFVRPEFKSNKIIKIKNNKNFLQCDLAVEIRTKKVQ